MSALPHFQHQGNQPKQVSPQPVYLPKHKNPPQLACTGDQGYPVGQGCPTKQGFTSERECSTTEKYPQQQGYLPEQGYSAEKGYQPEPGYLPGQEYPPQPEYPLQLAPPAYDEKQTIEVAPITTTITVDTQEQPNNYMWLAMFVTFFCCFPLGLIAWIDSCEVQSRFKSGDYDEAEESSKSARNWSMNGLLCGVVTWVVAVLVSLLYLVSILDFSSSTPKDNGGDALSFDQVSYDGDALSFNQVSYDGGAPSSDQIPFDGLQSWKNFYPWSNLGSSSPMFY